MELLGGIALLAGVYLYGIWLGRKHGRIAGKAQADREWAVMLENGMAGPSEYFMGEVEQR